MKIIYFGNLLLALCYQTVSKHESIFAGLYYVSHTYSQSGEEQYVTIVALEDDTQVLIQKPDEEIFGFGANRVGTAGQQSNVVTYDLNALESIRFVLVSVKDL